MKIKRPSLRFRVTTNGKEYRIEKNMDCGFIFNIYEWHEYPLFNPHYFTDKVSADAKCRQLELEDIQNWERANLEWKVV